MIYILLFFLIILLGVAYYFNNRDLVSPSVIFTISFVFCSFWAVSYAKRWHLVMHISTFLVILLGVLLFVSVSSITSKLFRAINYKSRDNEQIGLPDIVSIDRSKLILFLLFEIVSIIMTINALKKITGIGTLSDAIYYYRTVSLFTNTSLSIPAVVSGLRLITNASGYWFAYVVVYRFIKQKRFIILELGILILSGVSSSLLGGRGNVVNMLLAMFAIFFCLYKMHTKKQTQVNFKNTLSFLLIFLLALYLFQNFGELLGRSSYSNISGMDYLAKYVGAEIKNLDSFLRMGNFPNKYGAWGSQTFINVIQPLGKYIGVQDTNYVLDLPYRQIDGFNLGNVYTTFYPFIYDFGYLGVFFLVPFMAIISQIVYEYAILPKKNFKVSFSMTLYGYIFSSLALSFFSNKFYEQNFSRTLVMYMIFWGLFNLYFFRLKLK